MNHICIIVEYVGYMYSLSLNTSAFLIVKIEFTYAMVTIDWPVASLRLRDK